MSPSILLVIVFTAVGKSEQVDLNVMMPDAATCTQVQQAIVKAPFIVTGDTRLVVTGSRCISLSTGKEDTPPRPPAHKRSM